MTEVVRVLLCSEHARGCSVSGATWLSMDFSVTKMCHNLLRDTRPPQALSRKLKLQDSWFCTYSLNSQGNLSRSYHCHSILILVFPLIYSPTVKISVEDYLDCGRENITDAPLAHVVVSYTCLIHSKRTMKNRVLKIYPYVLALAMELA